MFSDIPDFDQQITQPRLSAKNTIMSMAAFSEVIGAADDIGRIVLAELSAIWEPSCLEMITE